MSDTQTLDLELTGVYVHGTRGVMVIAEPPCADDAVSSRVYWNNEGTWYFVAEWPGAIVGSTLLNTSPLERFFLTADGRVYKRIKGDITEETIDPSDEGPNNLLLMRDLISVGDDLIAVGMARHAYRRTPNGQWHPIDQTCYQPRNQRTQATGFNAVTATPTGLTAVGYKGEIWHYNNTTWTQDTSPTTNTLTCTTTNNTTTLIGGLGTLLLGTPGNWETIPLPNPHLEIWSTITHNNTYYLATNQGLHKLHNNQLHPIPLHGNPTTTHLSTNNNTIWCIGTHHIHTTTDGTTWTPHELP